MNAHHESAPLVMDDARDGDSRAMKLWKNRRNIPHIGLTLGIFSALCYCLEKVAAKDAVNQGLDIVIVLSGAKIVNFLMPLPILFKKRNENIFSKDESWQLFGYTLFSTIGTYSLFVAIKYISVLDVTVLWNTNIVTVMLLSCIFLKYKINFYDLVITAFMIIGTVLMCKPTFIFGSTESDKEVLFTDQLKGCLLGIVCSIFGGMFIVINKKMNKTNVFLISCMASVLMSVLYPLIAVAQKSKFGCLSARCVFDVIFCGAVVTIGHIVNVEAVRLDNAVNVTFALMFEMPFSLLFQWMILGSKPLLFEIIGMALVIIGSALVVIKDKWLPSN